MAHISPRSSWEGWRITEEVWACLKWLHDLCGGKLSVKRGCRWEILGIIRLLQKQQAVKILVQVSAQHVVTGENATLPRIVWMRATVTGSFPPIFVFPLSILHWPLLLHSLRNFQNNFLPFSSHFKSTSWAFGVAILTLFTISYTLTFWPLFISWNSKLDCYFQLASEYIYCLTHKVLQPQDVKEHIILPGKCAFPPVFPGPDTN